MREVVEPFITAWREYLYRVIVTLVTQARASAAAERRRRNTLNYNDLLQLAAKMLRENGDVRRALQQKHRWLFVDEFQDTDPVQAEIIFLLAGREEGASKVPGARVPKVPVPTLGARCQGARRLARSCRCVPARSSSSAIPSSRSIASVAPTSRSTTRSARDLRKTTNADVVVLTTNFRSVAAAVRLGERGASKRRSRLPRRRNRRRLRRFDRPLSRGNGHDDRPKASAP